MRRSEDNKSAQLRLQGGISAEVLKGYFVSPSKARASPPKPKRSPSTVLPLPHQPQPQPQPRLG